MNSVIVDPSSRAATDMSSISVGERITGTSEIFIEATPHVSISSCAPDRPGLPAIKKGLCYFGNPLRLSPID